MEKLLEIRKKAKAKKPNFVRQDSHKRKSLKKAWRKPRGLQSKLRLNHRGKGKNLSAGYRSPVKVRGLDDKGLTPVTVHNQKQLEGIDAKEHSIIISGTIGDKGRVEIIKAAQSKSITILNIKKPEEYVKAVEAKLSEKKKVREASKKKKEAKKPKKKDGKKLSDKLTDEEKKDVEKKEKEKVLITKDK